MMAYWYTRTTYYLSLVWFGLVCVSLTTAQSLEIELPEYPGQGVLFEYGAPQILSEGEKRDLKNKLNEYQAQTDWETGILIVENFETYKPIWNDFLENVRTQGYNPNGLLLVVAADNRKTHLFVSPALEQAEKWQLSYSDKVLDSILVDDFRAGNFYEGFVEFVDYATLKTSNWTTQEKFWNYITMFLIPFLFLNPAGWVIILTISGLLFFWGKKRFYIRSIRKIYEKNTTLYFADLKGLATTLKNPELNEAGKAQLKAFQEKAEQFFEQRQRTYQETKALYKAAGSLENEFTEFVNNAEAWDHKLDTYKTQNKTLKDSMNKELKDIDL